VRPTSLPFESARGFLFGMGSGEDDRTKRSVWTGLRAALLLGRPKPKSKRSSEDWGEIGAGLATARLPLALALATVADDGGGLIGREELDANGDGLMSAWLEGTGEALRSAVMRRPVVLMRSARAAACSGSMQCSWSEESDGHQQGSKGVPPPAHVPLCVGHDASSRVSRTLSSAQQARRHGCPRPKRSGRD
jgi:hypothetical protein